MALPCKPVGSVAQTLESWSKKSLKELPALPNQELACICKDCDLCKAKSGLKKRLYDFGELLLKHDLHDEPDPDDKPEPDSHDKPDLKDMSDREIDLLQQLEAAEGWKDCGGGWKDRGESRKDRGDSRKHI